LWQETLSPVYTFDTGLGSSLNVEGTLAWSKGVFAAFPDYTHEIHHVIHAGEGITAVVVCRGTFTGQLDVGGHVLTGTGKAFARPYVKVLQFDEHGLVLHDHQHLDRLGLIDDVLPSA